MALTVSFLQLPHALGLPAPHYQTLHAAGLDLTAALPEDDPISIPSSRWRLVPTGIKLAIPPGYEAQVRPRSGLALKHGVTVLNSPGTIDADYRGELGAVLVNLGGDPFTVRRGDRIAQLVFAPIMTVSLEPVSDLDATTRGMGGFGSTGTATP